MQFSSIWPIDRTLSDTTTLGQSGPRSDGNEEALCIPQSLSITGTSPSDCLVSYLGHSLERPYPLAEKQSVYSTAPADWVTNHEWYKLIIIHNILVHQLPWYYQPQLVHSTTKTASVTWYTCCHLVCTKIMQNFWLILIQWQTKLFNKVI